MPIKGLERVIRNLDSLDRNMIPKATVWATNRVARVAVSAATRKVAKETIAGDNRVTGIPLHLVRERVRISSATTSGRSTTDIRVNRGNLPAIKLGTASVRLSRRKSARNGRGSVLKIGRYLFRDAFVQQLTNGRWHVMRRIAGKSRYPIDVVKIPLADQLTAAFEEEKNRMLNVEMPKQLGYAIKQQLRLYLKR
ncbi:hypothetical protein M942_19975 [Enterobacter ludwigii]|nr:hypothetical protein M942_19975 [Enterobacter ludwigii]